MTEKKSKSVAGKKALLKAAPAAVSAVVTPEVVESDVPNSTTAELRKKELIDLVVARSGVKKRDAKPAIEALLAILGESLSEGRELNAAPLGKLKVTRMKKTTKAQIVTMRLRRTESPKEDVSDPLAQAAE